MKKGLFTVILSLLLLAACTPAAPAPIVEAAAEIAPALPNPGLIAPEALFDILDTPSLTLIDVRTAEEIADTGRITGAIHIPLHELEARLAELPDQGESIAIYCRTGNRSNTARQFLLQNGYSQVYDLDGGIVGWQNAGFQLVKDNDASMLQGEATEACEDEIN